MRTRCSLSNQSPSPGAVAKASWKSSRLRTVFARDSVGECVPVVSHCCFSSEQLVAKAAGPVHEEGAGAGQLSRAANRDQVGPVGDIHAAEVADVLADRQRPVNELAGKAWASSR